MNVLDVKHLSKSFGSAHVLSDISFSVEKGEIFGFLGPNGAGKSTTIRCIMDFLRPTKGEIAILGKDARTDSVELKKQIGYVPAEPILYDGLTVATHIELVHNGNDAAKKHAYQLLRKFDLDKSKKVKELSTGNQQKLALTLALASKPSFLLLDEPTRGLDPLLRATLHTLLKEYQADGGTVLLSSHDLSEVEELCDRVVVIREGKLIKDTTVQKLRSNQRHNVKVTFAETVPDLSHLKLEDLVITGKTVQCLVAGNISPLIAVLSKQPIKELSITGASLEDVFKEIYS